MKIDSAEFRAPRGKIVDLARRPAKCFSANRMTASAAGVCSGARLRLPRVLSSLPSRQCNVGAGVDRHARSGGQRHSEAATG